MRRTIAVLMMAAALALGTTAAEAKSKSSRPDATIKFSGGSVGAGIGFSWGSGTVTYKGKTHNIKVDGLSVGDVGVTSMTAVGNVFHLKSLEDLNGTYTAASAGAAAGGGGSLTTMRNQNGVVINMHATSKGVKLKLAVDGVKISLTE